MRRLVTCALLLTAGLSPAGTSAQTPSRDELLDRASTYVQSFVERFKNVVAEERYVQETTVPRRRRVITSDLLMVMFPGATEWQMLRDVSEVDGRSVRTEDERNRLTRLFVERPSNVVSRIREITEAGARYNLWDIGTVNNPLLSLAFLQPSYRDRFRFTLARIEKDLGPDVRTVQFVEFRRPTILHGSGNNDLPARGLIWIEQSTGRVVQTELRLGDERFPTMVVTRYAPDADLQISVPVEMRDWYPDRNGEIKGVATYGRFRRFQVSTEEDLRPK